MLTINNTTTIIADGQRSTSVHTELFSDGETVDMTITTDLAEQLTGRIFPPDDFTGIQASESAAQLWHSFSGIVRPMLPLVLAAARAAKAREEATAEAENFKGLSKQKGYSYVDRWNDIADRMTCELCHGEGNCSPGCPHDET